MDKRSFEDRRTFQRFPVDLPLFFSRQDNVPLERVETRDISAQGIGVTLGTEVAPGTPVYVTLRLPQSREEFPAEGTVVWTKNYGTSVRAGIRLKRAELMEISSIIRICHLHAA